MTLTACRPAPVKPHEKARLLAELPREGEVHLVNAIERSKLRALQSVFRVHERESVYEVKVVDVPQATAALHGRAVVLIAQPAFELLNMEELQAMVAHEIGHEYVWREYSDARQRGDLGRVRELELACDAIAVLTLQRIGVRPDRLITAMEKVYRFNGGRFDDRNASGYPSLKTRRDLIKRMAHDSRR